MFHTLDPQSVLALQHRDDLRREAAEQRLRHEAESARPRPAVPAGPPRRRSWWVVLARPAAHGPPG